MTIRQLNQPSQALHGTEKPNKPRKINKKTVLCACIYFLDAWEASVTWPHENGEICQSYILPPPPSVIDMLTTPWSAANDSFVCFCAMFLNKRSSVSEASPCYPLCIFMKSLFCNDTWWPCHLLSLFSLVAHSISLLFPPKSSGDYLSLRFTFKEKQTCIVNVQMQ